MKTKLFTLILLFLGNLSHGHQDFYNSNKYKNIQTRIKTGYFFEDIQHLEMLAQYTYDVAKKLNYHKSIFLDFDHHYVDDQIDGDYFVSFDKGKIIMNHYSSNSEPPLSKPAIVIRIVDDGLDFVKILKLVEYAILNRENIEENQQSLNYQNHFNDWTIVSIPSTTIVDVLNTPESEVINAIKNKKIYRSTKINKGSNFTYYWQNGMFHVIRKDRKSEIYLKAYKVIKQFTPFEDNIFVFPSKYAFENLSIGHRDIMKESELTQLSHIDSKYDNFDIKEYDDNIYIMDYFEETLFSINRILVFYDVYHKKILDETLLSL